MGDLRESHNHRLYWYDADKTIIMLEVLGPWTWDEMFVNVSAMKSMNDEVDHGVYTIVHFINHRNFISGGRSKITNLKHLLRMQRDNDELIVYVGMNRFIRQLLELAAMTGFSSLLNKFRFVDHVKEAFNEIERHKKSRQVRAG